MVGPGTGKVRIRRRVALLMDAISDEYQASIVRGAASAAQHAKLELVCLAGGVIGEPEKDARALRNFVFELLEPASFDGVLMLTGVLCSQVGADGMNEWSARFSSLPMVSLGVQLATCHSVLVEGFPGMKETIRHLIEEHNHRRIAFIRGPVTNLEAEERFAAYRAALADAGINEDPRLILHGTWLRESGAAAVSELFDGRGMKVDAVSAIAAANDYMALGAMDALRDRGISVPSEVAITGFDDVDAGRCAVPPLTTVQQPTEAIGREGIKRLLGLMSGKDEPRVTRLSATVLGRRSCGCSKATMLAHRRSPLRAGRSLDVAVLERRELIFAELSRSARGALVGAGSRWEERLLSALVSDLQGGDGAVVTFVDQLMAGLQRAGGELAQMQPVLSVLRRSLQDCAAGDVDAVARIDYVLDSALELVGEWMVRSEMLRRVEVIELSRGVSQVSAMLLEDPTGPAQRKRFEEALRRLGIPALSLGAFTEPGGPSPLCQCLAAYEPSGRAVPESQFRSSDFAAPGIFDHEHGALLVQPLIYAGEAMGMLTVPLGSHHGSVYEQMRENIGTGLRGYRLAARVLQLQNAIKS